MEPFALLKKQKKDTVGSLSDHCRLFYDVLMVA